MHCNWIGVIGVQLACSNGAAGMNNILKATLTAHLVIEPTQSTFNQLQHVSHADQAEADTPTDQSWRNHYAIIQMANHASCRKVLLVDSHLWLGAGLISYQTPTYETALSSAYQQDEATRLCWFDSLIVQSPYRGAQTPQ